MQNRGRGRRTYQLWEFLGPARIHDYDIDICRSCEARDRRAMFEGLNAISSAPETPLLGLVSTGRICVSLLSSPSLETPSKGTVASVVEIRRFCHYRSDLLEE